MKKDTTPSTEFTTLRHQAEQRLREEKRATVPPSTSEEIQRLHHELQVHQIELEMQNEELRQAKNDADEALVKFVDLYDFAPIGYVTLDPKRTILAVNFAGAALLGEDRSRLIGCRLELFVANNQPQLLDFFDRVFAGHGKETCSVTLRPVAGKEPYVRMEAVAAKSGKECRVAIIDITDLRQEELFHLQVECVEDFAICMLDTQGRILNWNAGAERLMGYRAEEIICKHFSCFYLEKDRKDGKPEAELKKAAAEGRFSEECWRIRKDGSGFWADVVLTPLRNESGNHFGFSKVMHDITERKKTEETLSFSEARYRALFEDNPTMIFTLDTDWTILSANPFALSQLGYTREELEGQSALKLFYDDDRAGVVEHFRHCMKAPHGMHHWQCRKVRKDGTLLWVEESARAVHDLNGSANVLMVCLDVTERKRAVEEILQLNADLAARAAELATANQELEAFSYTVAHDLRQPLNVISGYCQAFEKTCGEDLQDECKEFIREVYKGALKMDRLIGALLNFSHMGRIEPCRQMVDLSMLVHEVALTLRVGEPERQVEFRIADGITANADPNLLRVVMENLLGNAWKYTGNREQAVIEFGAADFDGRPAYYVRDNGTGFDMSDSDQLFVPFRRLQSAGEFRGFGIGLATVQRIIQRHGGRVWAEGEPDKGATFYFTLPVD